MSEDACRQYIDSRSVFTAWEEAYKHNKKERAASLSKELIRHQRMNWALYVGQAPRLLVDILQRLYKAEFAGHLTVIGPCSLYAYEISAAIVKLNCAPKPSERNHLILVADDIELVTPVLATVKKADKTFHGERNRLINNKGFEVEVRVEPLQDIDKFSSIVVAKSGHMARLNTVAPHLAAMSGFDDRLLEILQKIPLLSNITREGYEEDD